MKNSFVDFFVIPKCAITASSPTDITKNILFIQWSTKTSS